MCITMHTIEIFQLAPNWSSVLENNNCYILQERLEQIADELRTLGERTEELVLAAQQVRDMNDYPTLHTLQQQLEMLQGKQTQLLLEQSDLIKQQQQPAR